MHSKSDGVSEQIKAVRKRGRPEFQPTDEQRETVRRMRAEGHTGEQIAKAIGIGRNTLRRRFPDDAPVETIGTLALEGVHQPGRAEASPEPIATGRPEFEPSLRQREDVRLCKADDWSDDRIARHLGIARNTLLKHFADELESGADQVRIRNLKNLQRAADNGSFPAAKALIEMAVGLPEQLPVPPPEHQAPDAPEPLGKKEAAKRAALTAEEGTSWETLLH